MGLKILHSADWHLDSPFASLPEANRAQLRLWQRRLPGIMADLCIREQCDLVLLAGDLFDGKATRESIDAVKRSLARCGVPVCIAPGNHDFCGPDSPWMVESWPENVHIFTGDLTCIDLEALDCRVYGAGYRSMDCPGLLEGFRAEGERRYCVGVLHGDPMQLSSPCCPVTAAQVRESGLDYLALGHIHRSGSFRAGNTLCAWPGCPMGRGWDEIGEKGMLLVSLEETAELTPVILDVPRFYDISVPVSALEDALSAARSSDCYRVTLTGARKPDLAALEKQFSHIAWLELRDETEAETDLWAFSGDDSLRGVFFRQLEEQLENADARQTRIIRLAAEISHRLLEGKEVELP